MRHHSPHPRFEVATHCDGPFLPLYREEGPVFLEDCVKDKESPDVYVFMGKGDVIYRVCSHWKRWMKRNTEKETTEVFATDDETGETTVVEETKDWVPDWEGVKLIRLKWIRPNGPQGVESVNWISRRTKAYPLTMEDGLILKLPMPGEKYWFRSKQEEGQHEKRD
tara:strand:- start:236 stop:733 length:498 start_codon:yes stop_codon:yes gene_type:complete